MITTAANPCDPSSTVCNWVYDATGKDWLATTLDWIVARPLSILFIVLVGFVVRWLLFRLITKVVDRAATGMLPQALTIGRSPEEQVAYDATLERRKQRAHTLGSVLRSLTTAVVFAIVFVILLAELGYDIGPIIAGAGIAGIALGFGAQSLVSDFIAGMFMLFEDQYGVGDVIDIGGASGTVEAVTLRVTRLRDVNGTVWFVRNGELTRVGNKSQNWARTVLDVSVAYGEDISRVKEVLLEEANELRATADFEALILEEPEVWGIESLGSDGIDVRVVLKTAPLAQWAVARALRERIKRRFDAEGIEIPFPQRVVWQRETPVGAGT
ncbi:MAG: mechanosensitive ion channel [Frankiales bacterium]|nr:mechanosensitive ion channel [Frankiales bacterium]